MKSYRMAGIALAVSLACLGSVAQADAINLITNGDFTTNMTGWEVPCGGAGRLDATQTSPLPDGPCVYMNLVTWLQTKPTASLAVGQTYEVSFLARILGSAGTPNAVDATLYAHVNSTTNGVIAPYTALLTSDWQRYSYQFTPLVAEVGGGYGVAFP